MKVSDFHGEIPTKNPLSELCEKGNRLVIQHICEVTFKSMQRAGVQTKHL